MLADMETTLGGAGMVFECVCVCARALGVRDMGRQPQNQAGMINVTEAVMGEALGT